MKISLGNICAKKSVSLASSSKIATGPESSLSKGLDFNSSSTPSSLLSAFDSSSSSVCLSSLETSSTSISELTPSYSFVKPPKLFLFVRYDPKQIVYEIHRHYKPFLKSVRPYENMLFTVLNAIILKFYCGNPMTSLYQNTASFMYFLKIFVLETKETCRRQDYIILMACFCCAIWRLQANEA